MYIMTTTNADHLAIHIAEVTISRMYNTINHQLAHANIDLDGDDYWDALESITDKTIKEIINILNK